MFSSSSSSGGGGGCGGGAGSGGWGCGSNGCNGGGSSGVWSSGMKKQQKRPKIPKRGPGVAELEKILREREKSERSGININHNISTNDNNNSIEGFSVSPSCFNLHHHLSPPLKPHCPPRPPPPPPPTPLPPMPETVTSRPPPPPPSRHVPIAPRFDHLSPPPPPPSLYGYNISTQQEGRNFLEQPLFPMNPSACDGLSQSDHDHHHSVNSSSKNFYSESGNNNHLWTSHSALPQKRHCTNQYSSSMMKQILGPCAPLPSSSSLPTGLHNHEPPSNQSSYFNCISRNSDDPKMVGMKRPLPSSFENSLVPSSTFQVTPCSSNLITRPHNKSSSNNDRFSRDVKWGGPLGFNRKFGSEISNGGFSSFNGSTAASSPVPSAPMLMFQRELCNNNPNYQVPEETMKDSYRKSESSSGSDQRPFFNFLEVKDLVGRKETVFGSNPEGSEVGINGPDLTLKL